MKKISARHYDILFKFFLAAIMTFVMSLIITTVNIGLAPNFLQKWAVAYAVGFVMSFIAIFIAVPITQLILKKIVEAPKKRF